MSDKKRRRKAMPYGPVSDFVLGILSEFKFHRDYLRGTISQSKYIRLFDKHEKKISYLLFGDEHLISVARSYPKDFNSRVRNILSQINRKGMVQDVPDQAAYQHYADKVGRIYRHGSNHTFIQPDEAQLLYHISISKKPARMVAIGSYYGYWAIWAMHGIQIAHGKAILVDPNPKVCALARSNFQKMGYGDMTTVFSKKAEDVLPKIKEPADIVLLDAAGSHESPDQAYRGKGIYSFLIGHIFEKMADRALLVVHNDVSSVAKEHPLKPFHAFCKKHFRRSFRASTPEGVGIYQK